MPDFPIIDAHVHLYDPAAVDYPWMAGVPALNAPHLPDRFRSSLGGVEVEGVVFVEVDSGPAAHMDEARFLADLRGITPLIRGMVGSMPLEEGPEAVAADLAAWAATPGARGVRRLIQAHVDEPGWSLREPFVEAVRTLAAHDLSFDLCLFHPQMKDAIALVRACSDVRFVLDHIGKPGIRDGLTDPWRDDIAALAREPNVWCKISGVVTEADHAAWTVDQVAPYIKHALSCFGYDRCMFGGDWPVSTLATTYRGWVDVVDGVVAGATPSERERLYRDTAREFYSLDRD
jgi:L-fuconolactonase